MTRACKFFLECKKSAVIYLPYANLHLCKDHFIHHIEKRVEKTIEKYKLIDLRKREKILVALSGGKDSSVLLNILHKLYGDKTQLEAYYVELGIQSQQYSLESGKYAEKMCQKLAIPFHSINTKNQYGFDIDDLHNLQIKKFKKSSSIGNFHFRGICSYCGVLKRYSINKFATENHFDKVATGHNLTDESITLIINFFNMDQKFLGRSYAKTDSLIDDLVPRIKPLFYTSEQEIIMYAYYNEIDYLSTECEYSTESPNLTIKQIFQELDSDRKGLFVRLMNQYQKKFRPLFISEDGHSYKGRVQKCRQCGMSASGSRCSFCRDQKIILNLLNSDKKNEE